MNLLLTGATSGIGETTARYLSSQGHQLMLVARNREKLEQLVRELPGPALFFPFDLQDLNQIGDIFQFVLSNEIKLDGLIHCAGMNRDIPVKDNIVEDMCEVMHLNALAFIELGKYFVKKKYSADGSSMVALSSMAANRCNKGMSSYAASKAALNAAVQVMAKEFARRRIRVNAILPAFVDTPMTSMAGQYADSVQERLKEQTLGLIDPIQVAYMIEFLLSKKSEFVTGALIPISAGAV